MKKTYNVLDEPWIPVKYLNGKKSILSLIDVLEQADKIEDILPPVFRNDTVYIYYVGMIRLLTTIIEAAYYKKETKYASKNLKYLDVLNEQGLNSEAVKNYLEKYHDRFDVLSETHPFLQNINLKPELETADHSNNAFLTWNPMAPSENNFIFGRTRRQIEGSKNNTSILSQYQIVKEEFVHMLIYLATIGNYPAATVSLESSLGKKISTFAVIKGRNLKETILANILPLDESSRPLEDNEIPDMPVWEMENIHDIEKYDKDQLVHNLLCRAFFPGISVLGAGFTDDGQLAGMVRNRVTKRIDPKYGPSYEMTNSISDLVADPFAIVSYKGDDGKFVTIPFDPIRNTAHGICIMATKHTDKWNNCKIINNRKIDNEYKVQIYYRELDGMNVTLRSCGALNNCNGDIWEKLKDTDNHIQAVKYQENYSKARSHLKRTLSSALAGSTVICSSAEKELSDWMEHDFFTNFSENLSEDVSSAALTATDRLVKETVHIFDKYTETSDSFFTVVSERRTLASHLKKITQIKEKDKNGRK